MPAEPDHWQRCWLSIGSNLGQRSENLAGAVEALGEKEEISLIRRSPIFVTPPWGVDDQPDFHNAVVEFAVSLAPLELLGVAQEIEKAMGRERSGPRWGPRLIDIDILLFGNEVMEQPGLVIPHPRMHRRLFVLEPLAALEPDLVIPGHGTVQQCLDRLRNSPGHEAASGTQRWPSAPAQVPVPGVAKKHD
ncbi:MAG: 2-amino-4-hydroxy-6-hydroxymethyldihydropteridine diphosphokinase [Xanthomonadales bacterium]|nr:2-amino-4-hydroxy-6-hydroxymethyldihydropteridine diphosphokinase [Xanthomonadales bacterium]